MRPREAERTGELIADLDIHPVTSEIARHAGLVKNEWKAKGFTLTLADTMIAATAIAHKLVLITDKGKDFPTAELQVKGLG